MKNKLFAVLFLTNFLVFGAMAGTDGIEPVKVNAPAESPAAVTAIEGKVIDMTTGETLAGAEITIEGTDMKAYTDLDGHFSIERVKPGKYNIICSLISYNKSLVENLSINIASDNKCEIALESSR